MDVYMVVVAAAGDVELPMPTWGYGVLAAVVFVALALVTYSYRNVANRHSHKTPPVDGHNGSH